jgi:putative ABC transport system ATP-binding protein
MTNSHTIIETINLTKIFGSGDAAVVALNSVNIRIEVGEFVAVMGPSGSGKSTLMNIIGCLSSPTSGKYLLDTEDVSNLDKNHLAEIRNHKIGYVFQTYNLLPRTTAIRNVVLPLVYDRMRKTPHDKWDELAKNMLERVGLSDRMNHQPSELSGGQQQRVAIARALINNPLLILADEPTGNLDSKSGKEIMGILQTLHDQGSTIVVVTHDPIVADCTERTIHLIDGSIDTIIHNGKNHEKETKKVSHAIV